MKFQRIKRRNSDDVILELTPLIDVVFLLLIFFMVSTSFVDINTGINIDLPQSTIEKVVETKEIVVTISKKYDIYLNKKKLKLDDLELELTKLLTKTKKSSVIIKGDNGINYGTVVQVMTICKKAGATGLDIATDIEK